MVVILVQHTLKYPVVKKYITYNNLPKYSLVTFMFDISQGHLETRADAHVTEWLINKLIVLRLDVNTLYVIIMQNKHKLPGNASLPRSRLRVIPTNSRDDRFDTIAIDCGTRKTMSEWELCLAAHFL